jgi:hemerythrin
MRAQRSPIEQQRLLAAVLVSAWRSLARAMSTLACASDERVVPCYRQLVAATEQAFRAEELAAEHINPGTIRELQARHARVLLGLHEASTSIEAGDLGLAREALTLLSRFLLMNGGGRDVTLAATSFSTTPNGENKRTGDDTPLSHSHWLPRFGN